MFGDFFKKKPQKVSPNEQLAARALVQPVDMSLDFREKDLDEEGQKFLQLVVGFLNRNGVSDNGTLSSNSVALSPQEEHTLTVLCEEIGFFPNIETVIMDAWEATSTNTDSVASPSKFAINFVSTFHNVQIEYLAPEYIQERNKKIINAYRQVVDVIKKIQGWLDDEDLRKRFETDSRQNIANKATLHQCSTMFCCISVGYTRIGVCNLVFSVDYRFKEMISEWFASVLLRRIFEFTPGGMEAFVKIGSLYMDCVEVMQDLTNEAEVYPWHILLIEPRHDGDINNPFGQT